MSKPLQLIYLLLLINFLILILLNNQDFLTLHNNQLSTCSHVNADKFKFKLKKLKKKIKKKLKKKKMIVVPVPIKGTVKVHHFHHMPKQSWGGGNWGEDNWSQNPWGLQAGHFLNDRFNVFTFLIHL